LETTYPLCKTKGDYFPEHLEPSDLMKRNCVFLEIRRETFKYHLDELHVLIVMVHMVSCHTHSIPLLISISETNSSSPQFSNVSLQLILTRYIEGHHVLEKPHFIKEHS